MKGRCGQACTLTLILSLGTPSLRPGRGCPAPLGGSSFRSTTFSRPRGSGALPTQLSHASLPAPVHVNLSWMDTISRTVSRADSLPNEMTKSHVAYDFDRWL